MSRGTGGGGPAACSARIDRTNGAGAIPAPMDGSPSHTWSLEATGLVTPTEVVGALFVALRLAHLSSIRSATQTRLGAILAKSILWSFLAFAFGPWTFATSERDRPSTGRPKLTSSGCPGPKPRRPGPQGSPGPDGRHASGVRRAINSGRCRIFHGPASAPDPLARGRCLSRDTPCSQGFGRGFAQNARDRRQVPRCNFDPLGRPHPSPSHRRS